MGGGVGISAHGSMRIVTEHSIIAMPECSIGLIPDVGASHLLAQAPGFVGEYLSMTGMRMKAGDALFAGFADHYVASDRLPELKKALIETGNVDAIKDFKEAAPESCLKRLQTKIDTVFKLVCVGDIVNTLKVSQEEWCAEAYAKNYECLTTLHQSNMPGHPLFKATPRPRACSKNRIPLCVPSDGAGRLSGRYSGSNYRQRPSS